MIKNFDETKRQLAELATVLNSFKSEAVQLRIIELVLQGGVHPANPPPADDAADRRPATKPRRRKSHVPKATSETDGQGARHRRRVNERANPYDRSSNSRGFLQEAPNDRPNRRALRIGQSEKF